jgi:phage terminase large subunit
LKELQDEHGDAYGKSLWLQEYYCSFDAAIPGAIWADCLDRCQQTGRLVDFALDPAAPVDTGWDLGRTDDTALWFRQFRGTEIDVIDHYAQAGMDIDNPEVPEKGLVQVLLRKRTELGITYRTHYLPHDARARTLAAGGKSMLQQFQDAAKRHPELGRFVIGPRLDVQEGIQAARKTFPVCRFHATRCANGLESLRHYHREWDPEVKAYSDQPVHDWASHDADAWRTLSLTWKRAHPTAPEAPLMARLLAGNPTQQTFGAWKDRHLAARRRQREARA